MTKFEQQLEASKEQLQRLQKFHRKNKRVMNEISGQIKMLKHLIAEEDL